MQVDLTCYHLTKNLLLEDPGSIGLNFPEIDGYFS